jgi:hypothetical protein
MRQLTTTELTTISGGNDAAILGLGLGLLGIGMLASTPSYSYGYGYNYGYSPVYYSPMPVTTQVVTPVFDSYTGIYMGDMVDTYTTYY